VKRNVIEWAVVAVSVVAIAVLVSVLLADGLRESNAADPRVELHEDEGRQAAMGWIVPATITNDGDSPAEAVVVEAEATVSGETEASELEVAYLPAGSSVEIAFSFSAQPEAEISVRLIGYQLP
jgi:uncharacterized protein (TIGR02588 family)